MIEAPSHGWTDGSVVGAFALAVGFGTGFVAWELRVDQPMIELQLLRNPRFSAASFTITLAFFALVGMIFILTQYLQSVLLLTPLEAGVRMIPLAGGLVLGGPLSARLDERIGTKLVVAAGMVMIAGSLGALAQADAATTAVSLAVMLAVLGFGMGSVIAPATDSIMGTLEESRLSAGAARERRRTIGWRCPRRGGARLALGQYLPWSHGARASGSS